MADPLDVSPEVRSALNRNDPVVALESCVITHGLPRGTNLKTALAVEEQVRAAGTTPATIGIVEGKVRVGLSEDEIKRLAEGRAEKVAARDLPYAVARKLDGGATVSAAIRIASAVGIFVAATGGVGGVHRGEHGRDVSGDLWELARTPMIVVCSGPKAVLDVTATAEWLETHGVPIYGWQTDELPAFYSRRSGIRVPRVEDACDAAEIARLSGGVMGMRCATIVAVPVPTSDEVDLSAEIEEAVTEGLARGISGRELTPYLLARVGELSKGRSIRANVALLKNNAQVAAEIATALVESSRTRMGFIG